MKKPYWLKKKYLMYRFNGLFFSSISRVKETKEKKKMKEKKNLLVQIDGMGDCFIRLGLLNLMEQKYGKDKIVLLTGRGQGIDMFRYLGYECIDYNQDYLSLIETKKLYKELNKYNFGDLHLMNFYNPYDVELFKHLNFETVYSYENREKEIWWSHKETEDNFNMRYKNKKISFWKNIKKVEFVSMKGNKIIDIVYSYAKIIKKNATKEEIEPKLKAVNTVEKEYISICLGAGAVEKVIAPIKLIEMLKEIIKENPKVKFHVVGKGDAQEKYLEAILKELPKDNFINLIGKLSLLESIKVIAESKFYIGFDSGLYNIAYTLGKKIILIVTDKYDTLFFHESENIKKVMLKENDIINDDDIDKLYKNKYLNSIPVENFTEAYRSLS